MAVQVDGDVTELQLSYKHGGSLHNGQPRFVEVDVVILLDIIIVLVEQDEESQTKGDDEHGVPGDEEEKCL